jgi:hypothetical protein
MQRRGETLVEAQLRKEQALADLRQLEVWEKRGQVAPVGIINVFMAGQIMKARDVLTRIGPELQDRLAVETEPGKCLALIDREVRHALDRMSLFGEKWNTMFDGHGSRSEELRGLLGRMVEFVDG